MLIKEAVTNCEWASANVEMRVLDQIEATRAVCPTAARKYICRILVLFCLLENNWVLVICIEFETQPLTFQKNRA